MNLLSCIQPLRHALNGAAVSRPPAGQTRYPRKYPGRRLILAPRVALSVRPLFLSGPSSRVGGRAYLITLILTLTVVQELTQQREAYKRRVATKKRKAEANARGNASQPEPLTDAERDVKRQKRVSFNDILGM